KPILGDVAILVHRPDASSRLQPRTPALPRYFLPKNIHKNWQPRIHPRSRLRLRSTRTALDEPVPNYRFHSLRHSPTPPGVSCDILSTFLPMCSGNSPGYTDKYPWTTSRLCLLFQGSTPPRKTPSGQQPRSVRRSEGQMAGG